MKLYTFEHVYTHIRDMTSIAIINQKGGVGKSTTAAAIGAGLARKGYSVLFVDLDAQGNLSYSLGAEAQGYNAMGVLLRPETMQANIQFTAHGDILASSPALAGADAIITQTGKEYRLKEALASVQGKYDFCIVDTPPALGILTVNALTACHGAIVPAQADIFSLQGILQLNETLQTVKKYCNPDLALLGIVLTRFNGRAVLSRDIAHLIDKTAAHLETSLYRSTIRECTALKEAQAVKQSIYAYAPKSNAAIDYSALVVEILTQIEDLNTDKKDHA